jgi:urease gamma subunit
MILDKSDRRKSDIELKIEIDELKRMRNKDETEIKLLKVEMMKLQ